MRERERGGGGGGKQTHECERLLAALKRDLPSWSFIFNTILLRRSKQH